VDDLLAVEYLECCANALVVAFDVLSNPAHRAAWRSQNEGLDAVQQVYGYEGSCRVKRRHLDGL
jgi:hypothetical protein